jgi:hypothetical protein
LSARVPRTKGKTGRSGPPRRPDTAAPELQISYAAAGHETLAAIAEELAGSSQDDGPGRAPDISVSEGPVGRETLALITDLARQVRPEQTTLDYGDRISNAPGSKTPSQVPAPISSRKTEIPFAIFEMLTFVVQGPEIAHLSSDALRRRFVDEHLRQRLPNQNMADVERIDVTPWTVQGTVVVRVWCKV